jgi:hypothetical protein
MFSHHLALFATLESPLYCSCDIYRVEQRATSNELVSIRRLSMLGNTHTTLPRLAITSGKASAFPVISIIAWAIVVVPVYRSITSILRGFHDAGLVMIKDYVTHALKRHLDSFALLHHVVHLFQPRHWLWVHADALIVVGSLSVGFGKFSYASGAVGNLEQLAGYRTKAIRVRTSFSEASKSKLSRCRFTDSPYGAKLERPIFFSSNRAISEPSLHEPGGGYRGGAEYVDVAGGYAEFGALCGGAVKG